MSATDKLHFLLCEHGTCHAEGMLMGHPITYWGKQEQDGRWPYRYWDFEDGTASFSADPKDPSQTITPEQAIAATLGATDANPTQAESSGTCHNAAPSYLDFLCSECGFVHYHSDANDTGDGNEWHFCPNCGRRVER